MIDLPLKGGGNGKRDELGVMGVLLEDGKDPQSGEPVTAWEVAR